MQWRLVRGLVLAVGLIGSICVASPAQAEECKNYISDDQNSKADPNNGNPVVPEGYRMISVDACKFSLENSRIKPEDSWLFLGANSLYKQYSTAKVVYKLNPTNPTGAVIPVSNNLCKINITDSNGYIDAYSNSATLCATLTQLYFQQKMNPEKPLSGHFRILMPLQPNSPAESLGGSGSLEDIKLP